MLVIGDQMKGRQLIEERKALGIDRHDEVWDGVYVMPSTPSLEHQDLVHDLDTIFGPARHTALSRTCRFLPSESLITPSGVR